MRTGFGQRLVGGIALAAFACGLSACGSSGGGNGRGSGQAPTVGLAATTYAVGEADGSVTITVNRGGSSSGALSVDYATADGSATMGFDYTATAGTLAWLDGESGGKMFTIPILDDADVEGPETLDVALSNIPGNVVPGTTAAVVTINDDDVPPAGTLQLVAVTHMVGEAGGSLSIDVSRTGGSAGAVSVDYGTADGSAIAPGDYTTTSGTLNWTGGDVADKSIQVSITDDATPESDEEFTVMLTNALGGAAIGTQAMGTVTILDDDAVGGTSGDLVPGFGSGGVITADFGGQRELATTIEIDATHMYVGGYDEAPAAGMRQWRIEKRDLAAGVLDGGFGTAGVVNSDPSVENDQIEDMAIDSTSMYVTGIDRELGMLDPQWRVEKRALSDGSGDGAFGTAGVVQSNPFVNPFGGLFESPEQIVIDGTDMYVAGTDEMPGQFDYQWRVEKRNLIDGMLDSTFGAGRGVVASNPMPSGTDICRAVQIDGTHVYLVGSDLTPGGGNDQFRIEKIDKAGGLYDATFGNAGVQVSNPTGGVDAALAAASDGTWLYMVGIDSGTPMADSQWRIEKRSLSTGGVDVNFGTNGAVVNNPSNDADEPRAIVVDGSFIYICGWESVVTIMDQAWRIEKRNATNGSYDASFGTGGFVTSNPTAGGDVSEDLAVDSQYIYVVGWDEDPGIDDWEWRIEKRFK